MNKSYNKDYTPRLSTDGLYHPSFEHEACGVGLVANVKGRKSHNVIAQGLEVLINLGHRGAVGADPETGDGAGIIIQMPQEFISQRFGALGVSVPEPGNYGVGMTFLPSEPGERARCEAVIERVVEEEGTAFPRMARRACILRQDRRPVRAGHAVHQAVPRWTLRFGPERIGV